LILTSDTKTKRQEIYLKQYLDFLGVSYTTFKDIAELQKLERQINYDMLFVDFDYANEADIEAYANTQEELVLITKSYYMKKIDSMGLDIFKVMYEPMNGSKIKTALESFDLDSFNNKKAQKIRTKKFDAHTSKFKAKALVAEDNIINQKLIRRTLEDLGLEVSLANNGLEAFEKRKNGEFDVIFMDIQMPVLDGIEATQEILDYEEDFEIPHIPIIALTANALKGDRERFMDAGMDEYTTKPLVRTELTSLLNHFLADKIIDISETKDQSDDKSDGDKDATPAKEVKRPDIILTKKSPIETKLFSMLLDELKFDFTTSKSFDALIKDLKKKNPRVVLVDKELPGIDYDLLKKTVDELKEKTSIVMMVDPTAEFDETHNEIADEVINNLVNKELLRSIVEKYIK